MSFQILGTGSAHPKQSVSNDDLAKFLDTSDEWIYTRTGIKSRYICTDETISDLAAQAGRAALENAGVSAEELDGIICSTVRGDYFTPSLACVLQQRLGAACPAFDLNAACTGFLYALDVADGYFVRRRAKKILVVACENMSRLLDWRDRSTCVLFGDGAGAVVLGEGENLLSISLSAQGNVENMSIPIGGGNSPFSESAAGESFLTMKGQEIYKFAVASMTGDLERVIREAGLRQEDIDYVLPHQANQRIIDTAKKHLSIPEDRFCGNIDRYGNVSSASIPILLDELNRQNTFKKDDLLAFAAFGGGLTSGACVIRWG